MNETTAAPAPPTSASTTSTGSRPYVLVRGSAAHRALLVVGAVVVVLVVVWGSRLGVFPRSQLTRVAIFGVAITGLNIATGYAGLLSIGHSAFFGLGAYTSGILIVRQGWQPLATIPVALLVCAVAGLIVGLPAIRIRGLYLAMATLAFGVAFPEIVAQLSGLTGGAEGLVIRRQLLRPPAWSGFTLGEKDIWLYWLSAVILVIAVAVSHSFARSRYGLSVMASRDNEIAASSCGVRLSFAKPVSFGISAAITGVAGSLFAMYLGNLYAEGSFTLLNAITLLTGLIIGGIATRIGPIIGAFAVVYIPYYTADIGQGQASAVLFGAVLITLIFLAPTGLAGALSKGLRRVVRIVPATPPETPPAGTPPAGGG